jgi:hypothetical protein
MGLGIAMSMTAALSAASGQPAVDGGAERLRAALAVISPANGALHVALPANPERWKNEDERFIGPRPELVLITRDRSSGAELEFGAMGGGRAEAPPLLHVGLNLGF